LYNFYENNKGDQTLCPTYLVSGEKDGVRSFVIVPLDKLDGFLFCFLFKKKSTF